MDYTDEAKLKSFGVELEEAKEAIDTFLSSDGKNTVHCKDARYIQTAIKLFNFIKELYGTKQGQAVAEYQKGPDLGKCRDCGAPNILSKKTGKPYCSAKCWLK